MDHCLLSILCLFLYIFVYFCSFSNFVYSPGGKFDSDDEDKASEKSAPSGTADFKDDDDFSFRHSPSASVPRKPSGGAADKRAAQPKSARPIKKVDLGAAAAFASQAKAESRSAAAENRNQMMDVFFTESDPKPAQLDHEVDEFDPRAGENGSAYKPLGDFDGFSGGDSADGGFADFSSAFTSGTNGGNDNSGDDLFGDFNATSSGTTAASSASTVDLFAGVSLPAPVPALPVKQPFSAAPPPAAASNASAMDLLGGLDFASPSLPPLGLPSAPMGYSQPVMGMSQPVMGVSQPLYGGGLQGSAPLQPSSAFPTPSPQLPVSNGAKPVNVGSTWQDIGE